MKLKWWKPKTETRVVVKPLYVRHYSLAKWREQPDLVAWAQKLFASEEGQMLLGCLYAAKPAGDLPAARPVTTGEALIALGEVRGAEYMLASLESLANHQAPQQDMPEPDYGADLILKEEEFPQ